MRRDKSIFKFLILSIILVLIAIVLIISFITRNLQSKKTNKFAGEISKLSEELEKTDTASTKIGKTVEDVEKDNSEEELYDVPEISLEEKKDKIENENKDKTEDKTEDKNEDKKKSISNTKKDKEVSKKQANSNKEKEEIKETNKTKETNVEPTEEVIKFEVPINGEIIKEYARDSLVYSNTLQEWVTHNGIDIKADKTSVVKAVAKGKITAIKNDPRYGLTVIITHDGGYQSVYSNLLTSEFVVKGEQVEIGQSIGTVGNSASFEIADEYHLHFELLKDNEYVDPLVYINFE